MALNVSAIKDYVNANANELISKAILGAKTIDMVGIQTGVKGSMYLNSLTSDAVLQAASCSWAPSGTTSVSRRLMATELLQVQESICADDLIETAFEYDVKLARGIATIPFEQSYFEQKTKNIAKANELLIWQGDKTGSTASLAYIDGFIKLLEGEATVIDATATGDTLSAKPREAVAHIIASIPNEIIDRDDLVIFVGQEIFKAYVAALQAANLFHYTADLNASMEMVIPGYNIKLVGVAGLNATNKAYASYAENFVVGVDMRGDAEVFTFHYSQDNLDWRFNAKFNLGVQVRFPDFVVSYLN